MAEPEYKQLDSDEYPFPAKDEISKEDHHQPVVLSVWQSNLRLTLLTTLNLIVSILSAVILLIIVYQTAEVKDPNTSHPNLGSKTPSADFVPKSHSAFEIASRTTTDLQSAPTIPIVFADTEFQGIDAQGDQLWDGLLPGKS